MKESELRDYTDQELRDFLDRVLADTNRQEDYADNSDDPFMREMAKRELQNRPVIIEQVLDEMRRRNRLWIIP
ncbi:hypothetical protein J8I88_14935 [Duffyella gerundensis]|uniref:hypothetical protein n=1 Tax=Duffyella gerundensis TaxID=1619313 RepID=UPI001AE583C1|nr:hypothetical protein [Duffyella gerundensis]QTO53806.1 hypothetical protein J8I88_14935 [Duffyella gerundensis]